jgi:hypothetical protein
MDLLPPEIKRSFVSECAADFFAENRRLVSAVEGRKQGFISATK